jgi:hypothetical protein
MPDHAALARPPGATGKRAAALAGSVALALALALGGCAQPGTQAPKPQAARLAVGTGDISTACGYLEELTAFGGHKGKDLDPIESMAETGAKKLAAVYAVDQTDIYQGESIGAVLGDSVSLLHDCRLAGAQQLLEEALRAHH